MWGNTGGGGGGDPVLSGVAKRVVSRRVVLAGVPLYRFFTFYI